MCECVQGVFNKVRSNMAKLGSAARWEGYELLEGSWAGIPLRSGRGRRVSRSRTLHQLVSSYFYTGSIQGSSSWNQGLKDGQTGNTANCVLLCSDVFWISVAWPQRCCFCRSEQIAFGTWEQEPDVSNIVTCDSVCGLHHGLSAVATRGDMGESQGNRTY